MEIYNTPQISFVLPIYNVKPYLNKCLESIIATNVEKEIILIDDGSTDGSREVLKEYQQKYPYITLVCQSNRGVSAARNVGIKLAKAEYLQFVDPDDYLLTNDYAWLIQQAKSSKADVLRGLVCQFVNGQKYTTSSSLSINRDQLPPNVETLRDLDGQYFFKKVSVFPSVWQGFFRTAFLQENNFLFDERLSVLEDAIFLFDVLCTNSAKVIEVLKPIYAYQVRIGSIINNQNKLIHITKLLHGIDILWDKYHYYNQMGNETLKNIIYNNMILKAYKDIYTHYSIASNAEKESIKLLFTENIKTLFKNQLNINFE